MRSLSSSVETSTKTGATLAALFMVALCNREINLARVWSSLKYKISPKDYFQCPELAHLVFDGLSIMSSHARGVTIKLPSSSKLVKEENAKKPGKIYRNKSWPTFYSIVARNILSSTYLQNELAGVIRDFLLALQNIEIHDTEADVEQQKAARVDWLHRCNQLMTTLPPTVDLRWVYTNYPERNDMKTVDALVAAYNKEYETQAFPERHIWKFPTYREIPARESSEFRVLGLC
ncbi:hypothetical protein GNI_034540 [Gregarina niphandrodes]|uniref:Uncharacterized protein n=1 Tax=Gregarina niphandrodes TaxID=110365 RepID=A0A023BAS7_GRENI|nr:hypothetical protein GNI_034540 [Gregarina niphandrodes]EZG78600.1 hypothetical protein GNI_034540 [Gregarina niphandrodes]|eukprot:XP_011129245.1 hypothetical protein GNI_034540 [Gregarina niphandrodes]